MTTDIHFWSYLAQFFLESEMFQTKVVEKIKTHILCSVTFSRKSCSLWDNVEKYRTAGQTTDDSMAQAHCVLDTKRYKRTPGICILITFPVQQRLHERTSVLRCTSIGCHVAKQERYDDRQDTNILTDLVFDWSQTAAAVSRQPVSEQLATLPYGARISDTVWTSAAAVCPSAAASL